MNSPPDNLQGIKLLVPPLDYSRQSDQISLFLGGEKMWDIQEATREMIERATQLGALIIKDETGDPEFHRAHLSDERTFALEGSLRLITDETEHFFETTGAHIKQPLRFPYSEFIKRPEIDFPLFLASCLEGGEAKYLLENAEQLEKLKGLNKDLGDQPLNDFFEFKEFIPTPSNRYTSYRIITSATGEVIAAGLLYSAHTKGEKKTIQVPSDRTWNNPGDLKTNGLENPTSPFFLNAIDARSNIQQGGRCIPLLGGERARRVTSEEEEILVAHGIAPFSIEIPEILAEEAESIGKGIGKFYGLAVGLDFLQNHDTGEFYFLEANAGPGGQTFLECWFNGDTSLSAADGQRALLGQCFASIALSRSTERQQA